LNEAFIKSIIKKYEGTKQGRQEIYAEIIDDVDGALWTRQNISDALLKGRDFDSQDNAYKKLDRVIVAIDPAVTSNEDSDETGIIVAGIVKGDDVKEDEFYILEDLSGIYSPAQWAEVAINAYDKWEADKIIGECNNGGDLIERNISATRKNIPVDLVRASRGKITRAEPISTLYVRGNVGHVNPFPKLEDQLCEFTGKSGSKSPDRYDALVWALTSLAGIDTVSNVEIDVNAMMDKNPWRFQ
jgi:phage terminase large subunit-like protein